PDVYVGVGGASALHRAYVVAVGAVTVAVHGSFDAALIDPQRVGDLRDTALVHRWAIAGGHVRGRGAAVVREGPEQRVERRSGRAGLVGRRVEACAAGGVADEVEAEAVEGARAVRVAATAQVGGDERVPHPYVVARRAGVQAAALS